MRMLADLQQGESAKLKCVLLPEDIANRVMEAGFVPGTLIKLVHCAPGGSPRVYRLDGAEIAIRRELAAALQMEEES